ncbi:MAG: serine hydrolase [Solirubrobacterales bacterium]
MGVGIATLAFALGISGNAPVTELSRAAYPGLNLSVKKPESRLRPAWPASGAAEKAENIARSRRGLISFAAIGPGGRTVGFGSDRQYFSASVTKCMLLVGELRRLRREGLPLDDGTQSTLNSMITLSDNLAADQIYARVGDAGLQEVAKLAGMTHFEATVGHWSNAQITAADMTAFMSKLDDLLDLPGGDAASKMLASVIPAQSWGVPQAAPEDARVRFKGGWRPSDLGELVHQAARVDVGGESYSLAVLTDGNPSMPYGEETIRLIAAELLRNDERSVSRSRGSRSGEPGS